MTLARKHIGAFLIFLLLFFPFVGLSAANKISHGRPALTDAIMLWNRRATSADSIDQESFAAMMGCMGYAVTKLDPQCLDAAALDERTLLLVPHASSRVLSANQIQRIIGTLATGLRLITDGESPLLGALHFKLGKPRRVGVVLDHIVPDNNLHWSDRPKVPWIAGLPDGTANVLYADSATGHPLVVNADLGRGKCLVLGPYLDALSGNGYSRFPSLVSAIVHDLECSAPFRRQGVDAYFDAGYRFSAPVESLAVFWRNAGIRAVHASAWYYNGTPVYDYRKLIDAAHRNGILVYAWLEWPHIGQGFWDLHPEWRQKNALLQDAKLDFLHLMDLQNPACMDAALRDLGQQLDLDWDGVDIAEFTITGAGAEALEGPARPDYFTSFGAPMREEFSAFAGFDPIEIEKQASPHFWKRDPAGLERFYQYRKVVNTRLLRRLVEFVFDQEKKRQRDWEVIHTIVDNTLHPEFDQLLGFDLEATLKLVKEFGITLNVEDPFMEWENPPVRYRRLRQTLHALIPEHPSMIDVNVVPIHPSSQRGFASEQALGSEFLQQLQTASEQDGRVCVYSEWTVFGQDWPLVPGAMAGGSTLRKSGNGWDVSVPATVTLDAVGGGIVLDNGMLWPCCDSAGILLSAGVHHLTFSRSPAVFDSTPQKVRLVAISGEFSDGKADSGGFEITYSSPSRCLVTTNTPPKTIMIDGSEIQPVVMRNKGYCVFMAPSGRHRLRAMP